VFACCLMVWCCLAILMPQLGFISVMEGTTPAAPLDMASGAIQSIQALGACASALAYLPSFAVDALFLGSSVPGRKHMSIVPSFGCSWISECIARDPGQLIRKFLVHGGSGCPGPCPNTIWLQFSLARLTVYARDLCRCTFADCTGICMHSAASSANGGRHTLAALAAGCMLSCCHIIKVCGLHVLLLSKCLLS
jgi:hypothetical protein